jgi:hypothetical protein
MALGMVRPPDQLINYHVYLEFSENNIQKFQLILLGFRLAQVCCSVVLGIRLLLDLAFCSVAG